MPTWTEKIHRGDYANGTAKRTKSPSSVDRQLVDDFLRLVRVTGVCEHGLLIDDELILAELSADDLAELAELKRPDKQSWAQMLAYRLCMQRLRSGPTQR
jgi:hypothetical protein